MDRDPDTTIIVRYAMTMHDVEKERGVTATLGLYFRLRTYDFCCGHKNAHRVMGDLSHDCYVIGRRFMSIRLATFVA